MMKRANLLLIFSLFLATSAVAQNEAWTLEKSIEYALQNNIQLKINSLAVNQADENLRQSIHQRYPNLNAFVNHNYNWGRSFDVFTNTPVTQGVQSNNFGVGSSTTIYNHFRVKNTIEQNQVNLAGSKMDLEKNQNDLVLNIVSAYLQILFNLENLKVAENTSGNTNEQLDRTRKLVEGGALPKNNQYDLEAQLATNNLQVVNAKNTLAISYLQLKQLMQLENVENFEIEVPELPAPDQYPMPESPMEVYQTALTNQPDVKSADLNVKSAELGIRIAESNYYPSLTLNANINTFFSSAQVDQPERVLVGQASQQIGFTDPNLTGGGIPVFAVVPEYDFRVSKFGFFDQLDQALRPSIGFQLNIPIYNRNQAKSSVANARIQQERSMLNSKLVRNNLRQTIEQAYLDVLAAASTYSSNERQVEALEEQFRVTQRRYDTGNANVTDFVVSQNNLNNAKSNMIRAKYDYFFKQKILDFYLGNDITF